jgi:sulfite reductase (ferredoxin)
MSTSSAFVPVVVCLDVVDLPTVLSAGRRICAAGQPTGENARFERRLHEGATPMTTAKPVKRPRGEGQWKLGYREPLNPNEQFKKDDDALNVRARILDIYSTQGFDSIDKQDLRGRMRWMGLYTQREQGYDGTWTGDENADILEAKHFMMRVRCDGGALTNAALRTLGEISTEFARDTADISDRENVQYH